MGCLLMQAYLILALLFFAGIAVFVFQNPTMVIVHFINWTSPKVSLAVVVLIAACAGALIIFMVDSFRYFKIAKKIRELTLANKKLQNEVKSLKGEKPVRSSRSSKNSSAKGQGESSNHEVKTANESTPRPTISSDTGTENGEG